MCEKNVGSQKKTLLMRIISRAAALNYACVKKHLSACRVARTTPKFGPNAVATAQLAFCARLDSAGVFISLVH